MGMQRVRFQEREWIEMVSRHNLISGENSIYNNVEKAQKLNTADQRD